MRGVRRRFKTNASGATAIEYGLIAGLLAVVVITAAGQVGTNLSSKFNVIASNLGSSNAARVSGAAAAAATAAAGP